MIKVSRLLTILIDYALHDTMWQCIAIGFAKIFCDFLGNTRADLSSIRNSLGSENSISALENFHFRWNLPTKFFQNFLLRQKVRHLISWGVV